jgi:hypothetical protein
MFIVFSNANKCKIDCRIRPTSILKWWTQFYMLFQETVSFPYSPAMNFARRDLRLCFVSLLSNSPIVSYISYGSGLIGNFLVNCDILYRSIREPNDTGNEFSVLINNISSCRMLCVQAEMSYITRISPWFIAYYDFCNVTRIYCLLLWSGWIQTDFVWAG